MLNFIFLHQFEMRGSPFPLKIDTNKINIHFSGNLPSNRISLNMAVKELRQGFQPALKISTTPKWPTCFPIFSYFSLHTVLLQQFWIQHLPSYLQQCYFPIYFQHFELIFNTSKVVSFLAKINNC